jgi:hypothetical protein
MLILIPEPSRRGDFSSLEAMRLIIIDFEPYGKITLADIGNGPDERQG